MSRRALFHANRLVSRAAPSSNALRPAFQTARAVPRLAVTLHTSLQRPFSICPVRSRGIMPETENPSKEMPKTETTCTVIEMTEEEFHELSDHYLENVQSKFEELQDKRSDIDIEYSAGVMTINIASKGTYVINKQPPNKQIWLSSPISGPKRFDWCVLGESQADKEGTAVGQWIYTRDGSSLNGLMQEELGVDVGIAIDA